MVPYFKFTKSIQKAPKRRNMVKVPPKLLFLIKSMVILFFEIFGNTRISPKQASPYDEKIHCFHKRGLELGKFKFLFLLQNLVTFWRQKILKW
jgi:hypothetical protein